MEENRIAVVTGGNRGIGKEVCRQLASLGFTVILTACNFENAEKTADSIPGTVIPFKLDVTKDTDCESLKKFISESYERLDILVNNAGIISGTQGLLDTPFEKFREVFETNFFAPLRVIHVLIELLKKSKEGKIINISSGMGEWNSIDGSYAPYRLSKTGLNMITVSLARELSGTKIKVNSVCPGWVKTDMGGASAPRTVETGAETIVWLASSGNIPTGKFFRDKKEISF